ncbi:hypothetical protein [Streptomyces sp. NPDC087294]|uniref:hypothetical protein n=1 Tax=Streptomyces sp. NPDC087294 TaxID=3365777 RepID=UPI003827B5A3
MHGNNLPDGAEEMLWSGLVTIHGSASTAPVGTHGHEENGELPLGNGMFMIGVLALAVLVLMFAWAVLGIHGLLLGRMPGAWLTRHIRQPRLWGAGTLVTLAGWTLPSLEVLVAGIGIVILGHVGTTRRRN